MGPPRRCWGCKQLVSMQRCLQPRCIVGWAPWASSCLCMPRGGMRARSCHVNQNRRLLGVRGGVVDEAMALLHGLARDQRDYGNLCRIVTKAQLNYQHAPQILLADTAQYRDGLIARSGCGRGKIAHWIIADWRTGRVFLSSKYTPKNQRAQIGR